MRKLLIAIIGMVLLSPGFAQAVQTRTFEGRVTDIDGGKLKLEVGGEEVTVQGSERLFGQLKEGQIVSVQAQPELDAETVRPIEGAFAGDRLVGTVKEVGEDKVKIETMTGGEEIVTIDSSEAKQLKTGQNVLIELKQDPSRAENWRATSVRPVR